MEKVLIKNPKNPNDTVAYVLTDDFVYKDLYNKYDDNNETIWKTNANYKKYNQYINECVEYQLYAQKYYDADDCDKGNTHEDDCPKITFKCYICNVDVPLKYSENHRRSKNHITCLKLANNVMQRINEYIAEQLDNNMRTETRVIDDHLFCDICNLEIPLNERSAHDKSNEHLLLNKRASRLMKLVKVYTGNDGADGIVYDTADKQKDKVQNTETNNLDTISSGIVNVSDKINKNHNEGGFSTCHVNGAKTELQKHYDCKIQSNNNLPDIDNIVNRNKNNDNVAVVEINTYLTNNENSQDNQKNECFGNDKQIELPKEFIKHTKGQDYGKNYLKCDMNRFSGNENNKIVFTYCELCDVQVGKGNMEQHVNGNRHNLNINVLMSNNNVTKLNATQTKVEGQNEKEHVTVIKDNVNTIKQLNEAPSLYININKNCSVELTTNKAIDPGNNKSVQEKDINGVVEEPTPSSMNNDTHFIFCSICNVNVPRRGILVHIKGKFHKKVFASNKNEYTHCDICDVPINKGNMEDHVNEDRHKIALNLLVTNYKPATTYPKATNTSVESNIEIECEYININKNNHVELTTNKDKDPGIKANNKSGQVKDKLNRVVKKPIPNTSNNDPHSIFCSKCNVNVPRTGILEHIDGKSHKKIFADNKNEYTHCDICDVSISKGNMEEHVNGKKHKLNLNLLVANQSPTNAIPTPVEKQIKKEIITIINDNVKEYKQANDASNPYINRPEGVTTNKDPGNKTNNKSVQEKDINGVVEEPTPSSMNNDTHFIFCSICNVNVPRSVRI